MFAACTSTTDDESTNPPDETQAGSSANDILVPDPVLHDPTQLIAWNDQLLVWSSGAAALGPSLCPLVSQHLGSADSAWQPGTGIYPSAGGLCTKGGEDWPAWLSDETDGGSDFDAPGVHFDPQGKIPNAAGQPTQSVALYYSRYFNGSDSTGQACIGRVTASANGEGEFPFNLVWEDDGRPVLCSNTANAIEDDGESFADPGAGQEHPAESAWATNTNEALGLDAEIFKGFDGTLYMVYGSHAPGMIKIVELDPNTGRLPTNAQPGWTAETDATIYPTVATGPLFDVTTDGEIESVESALVEAAFVYPYNGYYYLFLNWFRCCGGENSTYQIVVGRSDNPLGPYVDKNGQSMASYYADATDERPENTPGGGLFS